MLKTRSEPIVVVRCHNPLLILSPHSASASVGVPEAERSSVGSALVHLEGPIGGTWPAAEDPEIRDVMVLCRSRPGQRRKKALARYPKSRMALLSGEPRYPRDEGYINDRHHLRFKNPVAKHFSSNIEHRHFTRWTRLTKHATPEDRLRAGTSSIITRHHRHHHRRGRANSAWRVLRPRTDLGLSTTFDRVRRR